MLSCATRSSRKSLSYLNSLIEVLTPSSRTEVIDLEAEFKPSLLNSAVYLLQLIQQISTFAVNYQGRPFRESLSENKGMFYGIVGVTAIAFACSTEMLPELNEAMKLVPFNENFKTIMTTVMIIDFVACYVIEWVLKKLFSDLRARDIAERRPDQLERERVRKEKEAREKEEEEERKERERIEAFERRLEEKRTRLVEAAAQREQQQQQWAQRR